jgi:hypothetical protein
VTKDKTEEATEALRQFARALGVAEEAIDGFVGNWAGAAQRALEAPKKELLWRLNERVQGRDPGDPVNWRGIRGFYA